MIAIIAIMVIITTVTITIITIIITFVIFVMAVHRHLSLRFAVLMSLWSRVELLGAFRLGLSFALSKMSRPVGDLLATWRESDGPWAQLSLIIFAITLTYIISYYSYIYTNYIYYNIYVSIMHEHGLLGRS